MNRIAWLVGILHLLAAGAQASEVGGIVFLDANGDGVRDDRERGVAGVLVSNGVAVVVSDAQGRWRLEVEDGQTLFAIKPAGFTFPRRADGLPDFWRHHRPSGSPPLVHGGIAPTPVLPASIDFALLPGADESRAVLAVVADPQPNDRKDVEHFRRGTMPGLAREPGVALGLLLGDIANDDLAQYGPLLDALSEVDFPWFALPGNHDLDADAGHDRHSVESWRARFGPDTYALQVGRTHVLMLDNVIAQFEGGRLSGYVGGLREDQFVFVENWLAHVPTDQHIIVAGHIPMTQREGRETFRRSDRERLYRLLGERSVVVLAGHAHRQSIAWHGVAEGRLGDEVMEWTVGAASGSFWSGSEDAEGIPHALMSDGTPRGFGLLEVGTGAVVPSWRAAGRPRDEVMHVHAPRVLRRGSYPSAQLVVNVYLGEAGTEVRFRIDAGPWLPMRRVAAPDPRVLAINVRQDEATSLPPGGRVPDAVASTHIWKAALPTDLAPGHHRITVEVRDRWERTWVEHGSYRLESAP